MFESQCGVQLTIPNTHLKSSKLHVRVCISNLMLSLHVSMLKLGTVNISLQQHCGRIRHVKIHCHSVQSMGLTSWVWRFLKGTQEWKQPLTLCLCYLYLRIVFLQSYITAAKTTPLSPPIPFSSPLSFTYPLSARPCSFFLFPSSTVSSFFFFA